METKACANSARSFQELETMLVQHGPNYASGTYVWLAYSIFFLSEPIFRRSLVYWVENLAIYAVFLAMYLSYMRARTQMHRLLLIAGLFILGVSAEGFNQGSDTFLVYVVALLPFSISSVPILIWVMLAETLVLFAEARYTHGNHVGLYITAFFVWVVGSSNMFVAQQKRADGKLLLAQEENVKLAAVAERERIARDLHDVLGHTLSVIVLKAELAGRLMGRDDLRAAAEIADVERTARTALAEVREAIGGYRSKGLNAEVEQARRTLDAAGVALTCDTRPPALPAGAETVLSLAVREAVTNIVRHAGATECKIRFATAADGFASFEVEDNGGAVPGRIGERKIREGNGLRGMRERVQEMGGRFRVEWDKGTRLVIELPPPVRG